MGSILAKPPPELVAVRPLGGLINLARPGGAAANEDAAPALRRCSIPADGGHRRLENSIRWPPIRPNQSTDNGGQKKKKGKGWSTTGPPDHVEKIRLAAADEELATISRQGIQSCKN